MKIVGIITVAVTYTLDKLLALARIIRAGNAIKTASRTNPLRCRAQPQVLLPRLDMIVVDALGHLPTSISLDGLTEYMRSHAKKICETFEIPFGSLLRTALAIQKLDGNPKLQSEHLQEAAQHLIIADDGESRYNVGNSQ